MSLMLPSLFEAIFWCSAGHLLLRELGASSKHPYRVMVRAGPIWLKAEGGGSTRMAGLYSTRFVMADSETEARASAVALVREAVQSIAVNPKNTPVSYAVEASNVLGGIVWHQARGFSFYAED